MNVMWSVWTAETSATMRFAHLRGPAAVERGDAAKIAAERASATGGHRGIRLEVEKEVLRAVAQDQIAPCQREAVKVHLDRHSRALKKLPVVLAPNEPGHATGPLSCGEGRDQGGKSLVALTEADRVDAGAMEIRGDQRGVMAADGGEDLRGVRPLPLRARPGPHRPPSSRRDGNNLRGEPRQGSRQIGFQSQIENFHVVIGSVAARVSRASGSVWAAT